MDVNALESEPRLTSLAHGGGCGCKMAPGLLQDILRNVPAFAVPKALLVGTETGDDAAVYQINETQALVATTDFFMPIVDDPADFGRIAATNAISDVYAMGARPLLALALVGMPVNRLSAATIGRILEGGAAACAAAGIPVAGGHSIDSQEPIYGLAVIGMVNPQALKRNAGARPGDVLVLGKALGIGVMSAALKQQALGEEGYAAMLASTTQLNIAGPELAAVQDLHALTDVTGFGLAGHALEMARGAACNIAIDFGAVPLLEGVRALAAQGFVTGASARNQASHGEALVVGQKLTAVDRALLTDPQTSGGLLAACAPEAVPEVLEIFRRHGCGQAAAIGKVLGPSEAPRLFVN